MSETEATYQDSLTLDRQRQLVLQLRSLIEDTARNEQQLLEGQASDLATLSARHDEERQAADQAYQVRSTGLNDEYLARLEEARHEYESSLRGSKRRYEERQDRLKKRHANAIDAARDEREFTRARAERSCVEEKKSALEQYEGQKVEHGQSSVLLQQIEGAAQERFRRRRVPFELESAKPGIRDDWMDNPLDRFQGSARTAQHLVHQLKRSPSARFLDEGWVVLLFLLIAGLTAFPFAFFLGWQNWHWIAASLIVALLGAASIGFAVSLFATRQARQVAASLLETLADARHALVRGSEFTQNEYRRRQKAIETLKQTRMQEADHLCDEFIDGADKKHEQARQRATDRHRLKRKRLREHWEAQVQATKEDYLPRMDQCQKQYRTQTAEMERRHESEREEVRRSYDLQWNQLQQRWHRELTAASRAVQRMNDYCMLRFKDLDQVESPAHGAELADLVAIPFGSCHIALRDIADSAPRDPRLPIPDESLRLPAFLSYPSNPSLILRCDKQARSPAVECMKLIMMRLLTSFPSGKVRFTIIDPIGLGQNFSAFMHLADYDPQLVTNRIWTESRHIEQRLADLTEHMENIIQKYLRNQFGSIQEYNATAGEVSEPFQVLVIADFPASFSPEAIRRLLSICESGARCGVYVLVSVDARQRLPKGLQLSDLESNANTLVWSDGAFHWQDDALEELPVLIEAMPDEARVTRLLRSIGHDAQEAQRVEVPFHVVAPEPAQCWSYDSREEISVALGRAGATQLQHLRLGRGTSQHVLISGKTGSGKSTLLHAMITNMALHYSPDELEFYLVDFKKGVEFKPYAQYALPHARVIAIESEREFGMSVLDHLDSELRRRGDLFRDNGVNHIDAFRNATPAERMPRVVLVIDEFQEFFVKDDRLAADASLLLDRLVRQGRAFGIHVILGSQTLAGAYSLARGTIGQIAVRIALQCSQSDAHLILSEDNTAARLLSRPGEAIYNNANGLFEGNHLFQIVWLSDEERVKHLREIDELRQERGLANVESIVFEGNEAADPDENESLAALFDPSDDGQPDREHEAWLGLPISIKDATRVAFPRASGRNLLIIGQSEELASGVLVNSLTSLAASGKMSEFDGSDRFLVLDDASTSRRAASPWTRVVDALPREVQIINSAQVKETVRELAAELERRQADSAKIAFRIFVVVHQLTSFRELQKQEDDYGFSGLGDEQPPDTAKQLATVIRDGPSAGIHVLAWCDSFTNVLRWFDRQTLREFGYRVLFRMNASDSCNLMDSADASHLAAQRAILHDAVTGQSEKFRPFRLPSDPWFDQFRRRFLAANSATSPASEVRS